MKNRHTIITAIIGMAVFSLGVLAGLCVGLANSTDNSDNIVLSSGADGTDNALQQAESLQTEVLVRINDGNVEWYDGVRWNVAAPVETLEIDDKYSFAKDARITLEEQLKAEKSDEKQAAGSGVERIKDENKIFIVGTKQSAGSSKENKQTQQKTTASSTEQTQTKSTQSQTASSQDASPADDSSDNDSSGDSSSGGNSSDSGSSDSGSSDSGSSDDSGDGEDMEWTDDEL